MVSTKKNRDATSKTPKNTIALFSVNFEPNEFRNYIIIIVEKPKESCYLPPPSMYIMSEVRTHWYELQTCTTLRGIQRKLQDRQRTVTSLVSYLRNALYVSVFIPPTIKIS